MLTRKLSAETPELSSVAAECRRTGEPVCVTENGRPAFVMMDMASFEAREARLSAREAALAMTSAKATRLLQPTERSLPWVSLLQVDSFSVLLNKHSNGWSADQPFSYAAEGRNLDPP